MQCDRGITVLYSWKSLVLCGGIFIFCYLIIGRGSQSVLHTVMKVEVGPKSVVSVSERPRTAYRAHA